jgi:nitrogen fixation-related uncharacterized protein
MWKKGVIALAVLGGLAYLFWGGSDGQFDAPRVSAEQTEPVGDFNRALFRDKVGNLEPRGMILKVVRGLSDYELRITMAEKWKALDYKVRIKFARAMWKNWEKLFPAGNRFKARIVVVDSKERKLGGSRLLKSSDIWVREK